MNEKRFDDTAKADRDAALYGSASLKEAIEKALWKFAWKHGITHADASHLLLNTGVRL